MHSFPSDDSERAPRYEGPIEVLGPLDERHAGHGDAMHAPRARRFPRLPLFLFVATCITTTIYGAGIVYSAALMFMLTAHEFGHYLQARRYRVPASLPYFIPLPIAPLGTMGAVIGMRGNSWNRKELFDIGITGPLAGLVPALVFSIVGLHYSEIVELPPPGTRAGLNLGESLLFRLLAYWVHGPLPADQIIVLGPLAFAGWVGLFITALNLMPISQLDGGHVIYALLREKAHYVTSTLLALAIFAVLWTQYYQWLLMLFLLMMIGPNHPPTADDRVALGTGRIVLGWLSLAFVLVGFTPTPFSM